MERIYAERIFLNLMPEIKIKDLLKKFDTPEETVKLDEIEYKRKIEYVARTVTDSGSVRVIFIAGPSASGKTTTANLIADEIRRDGEKCEVVSLDNFYRDAGDPMYPRLENGERDFESPYALNLDKLLATLTNIVEGRPFSVPKYDFKVGGAVSETKYPSYSDGCIIIEGIHGLNPILSDPFPKEKVLKVFVSVSTNIKDRGRVILSGRKLRFVRRLVRDSIFRASDAYRTLGMWENVLKGEDTYLYPYKPLADIKFDTFHNFEPAVMKKFAEKMLTPDVCRNSSYANVVARAMKKMKSLPETIVPDDSLIREFISGGIYEHLY